MFTQDPSGCSLLMPARSPLLNVYMVELNVGLGMDTAHEDNPHGGYSLFCFPLLYLKNKTRILNQSRVVYGVTQRHARNISA